MARALSFTLSICSSLFLFSQPYLTWADHFGSLQDQIGVDIHWTPDGGLLSTGTFEVEIGFNANYQFEALGERDVYVLKQNQNGGIMWAKHFGSSGDEEVRRIDVNDQGEILLSIAFSDTLTIDSSEFVSRGLRDVLIMRLDYQGNVLHTYHIESGGDMEAVDMAWAEDGTYLAMFQHRVKCFYTVGDTQDSLLSNGARDMGIMRFSGSDSLLWTHSIGGVGPSDHGQAIDTDGEGHYYIYGHFRETVDFDPWP
ncbi:MAG: hypothetical protein HKN79_07220 [Flavobacteriales bacterium]|nr:hypothetical protein [Flavobacteriales bacterium]